MSAILEVTDGAIAASALAQTENSAGWKLICDRVEQEIAEITEKILDHRTSDAEANELRRLRARMSELTPAAVMKTLRSKHLAQAKSQSNK